MLLHRNIKRFRGGLVFKAHRWLYHSTLGSRGIKKKREGCSPQPRVRYIPSESSQPPLSACRHFVWFVLRSGDLEAERVQGLGLMA